MSSVNGLSWLMFDPAEAALKAEYFPNMSQTQMTLLSSWQPMVYLLTAPVCAALLVRPNGLRNTMRIGVLVELLGSIIKLLSCITPHSFAALVALHIGQILSACVSPIAIGSPSHLAACWFPPAHRARATGAGVLANNVGNALGYFVIPALANRFGYLGVILFEFFLAIGVAAACLAFVPPDAVVERALTDADQRVDPMQETKSFLCMAPCLALCAAYSWVSGGYVAWTSMFDDLLHGTYSDTFIGTLSGSSTVAYVLGGLATSVLADSLLRGKLKQIILISSIGSAVFCLLFTISVPVVGGRGPLINAGGGWAAFVVTMAGACNGASAPIFYELAAEMSFPVSEGVSGNVLSYFENAGSLALYQVVSRTAQGPTMNVVYTVGMALACVCVALMPVAYHRTVADDVISMNRQRRASLGGGGGGDGGDRRRRDGGIDYYYDDFFDDTHQQGLVASHAGGVAAPGVGFAGRGMNDSGVSNADGVGMRPNDTALAVSMGPAASPRANPAGRRTAHDVDTSYPATGIDYSRM